MSIIGMGLAAKGLASGGGDGGSVVLGLLASPVLLPAIGGIWLGQKIADGFTKLQDKIDQRAEKKANKAEYESRLKDNPKLSEGKVGKVEVTKSEDGKTVRTIIHTEHGPFVKTEYTDPKAELWQNSKSVSYSGIRPITDENGKEVLVYIDNATQSVVKAEEQKHDYYWDFYTAGTYITETGERTSLFYEDKKTNVNLTCGLNDQQIPKPPKNPQSDFVRSVAKDFAKLLEYSKSLNNSASV